jgi:fructose-bisphosphate aldolase, class I
LGAVAIGATIYFGSENSTRQIQEVSQAFKQAHENVWKMKRKFQ